MPVDSATYPRRPVFIWPMARRIRTPVGQEREVASSPSPRPCLGCSASKVAGRPKRQAEQQKYP